MKFIKQFYSVLIPFTFLAISIALKSYLPDFLPMVFRLLIILHLLVICLHYKKIGFWILFALVAGIFIGIDFPTLALKTKFFSDIFIRLIKTIIAPLVFSTLVIGVAGHSEIKKIGRLGLKSIVYFELVTTIALAIGLIVINLTNAGKNYVSSNISQAISDKAEGIIEQKKASNFWVEMFPENIVKSIAENNILQVVIFSLLFAIGLSIVKNETSKRNMLDFCESLSQVMFKFTDIVMYLSPFAVFGAMSYSIAATGASTLINLLNLVLTLYAGLACLILLVFLPIIFIFKIPLRNFIRSISEPVSIAFATASSESALPKALENMEKFGVSKTVSSFVLPTGYSFNLDGTTLYLSVASVFVAQSCGMDLSWSQQVEMCLILMLTSKGVAGVRGASFLILVSTISGLGLDAHKAFPILAVDVLMDMGRTAVNVTGNCLASCVIARSEGEELNSTNF